MLTKSSNAAHRSAPSSAVSVRPSWWPQQLHNSGDSLFLITEGELNRVTRYKSANALAEDWKESQKTVLRLKDVLSNPQGPQLASERQILDAARSGTLAKLSDLGCGKKLNKCAKLGDCVGFGPDVLDFGDALSDAICRHLKTRFTDDGGDGHDMLATFEIEIGDNGPEHMHWYFMSAHALYSPLRLILWRVKGRQRTSHASSACLFVLRRLRHTRLSVGIRVPVDAQCELGKRAGIAAAGLELHLHRLGCV